MQTMQQGSIKAKWVFFPLLIAGCILTIQLFSIEYWADVMGIELESPSHYIMAGGVSLLFEILAAVFWYIRQTVWHVMIAIFVTAVVVVVPIYQKIIPALKDDKNYKILIERKATIESQLKASGNNENAVIGYAAIDGRKGLATLVDKTNERVLPLNNELRDITARLLELSPTESKAETILLTIALLVLQMSSMTLASSLRVNGGKLPKNLPELEKVNLPENPAKHGVNYDGKKQENGSSSWGLKPEILSASVATKKLSGNDSVILKRHENQSVTKGKDDLPTDLPTDLPVNLPVNYQSNLPENGKENGLVSLEFADFDALGFTVEDHIYSDLENVDNWSKDKYYERLVAMVERKNKIFLERGMTAKDFSEKTGINSKFLSFFNKAKEHIDENKAGETLSRRMFAKIALALMEYENE